MGAKGFMRGVGLLPLPILDGDFSVVAHGELNSCFGKEKSS